MVALKYLPCLLGDIPVPFHADAAQNIVNPASLPVLRSEHTGSGWSSMSAGKNVTDVGGINPPSGSGKRSPASSSSGVSAKIIRPCRGGVRSSDDASGFSIGTVSYPAAAPASGKPVLAALFGIGSR